jgi:hypothetical protein
MVEALGHQFLAGAALADYQYRTIERRGAAGALDRIEDRVALPDECFRPLHTPTVGDEYHDLARYFARKSAIFGAISYFSGISGILAWLLLC